MNRLFEIARGDSPLLVNVPHAGTWIPEEIGADLTPQGCAVPDTDWSVEQLYAFAPDAGATLMWATHSRVVVDLNRDPGGLSLYPGASNTEICPTTTFHDAPIYRDGAMPDAAAIAARVDQYWRPYHRVLAAEIERLRARHGYCILLDGHSIVSQAPRFFAGRLPDFNLGTADGTSCHPALAQRVFEILCAARGFTAVHNGRFKGGYITRHYGDPARDVHALQLEMAQCAYMNEQAAPAYDANRAAPLVAVLKRLVDGLTLGGNPKT